MIAPPIVELPKLENTVPKPENRAPELPLRDAGIRILLIPAFGIAIPYFVGYFGPYGPASALYWAGLAWAMLISFAIWHGNRFFLLRQRRYYDWFQHPVRKLCVLLFANVFYTAPVTVLMLLGWYRVAGFGPDWNAIRTATLCCIICVATITHVYETVYLIQQRESDLLAVQRLENARMEAELEAIKTQVAPHFLFNSLNTLGWLIEHHPRRAIEFNQDLAEVYRYILAAQRRALVPLEEELDFAMRYFGLLQLRFGDGVEMTVGSAPRADRPGGPSHADRPGGPSHMDRPGGPSHWFLPPISVQVLIENAVKHNQHSRENPLRIRLEFGEGHGERYGEHYAVLRHAKRPMPQVRPGAQVGLKNLDTRCRLALGRGIEVLDSDGEFAVRIPVRSVPA
ncbi:MAG: sensor histidine kinase [Bryobacteraceae bacterium]